MIAVTFDIIGVIPGLEPGIMSNCSRLLRDLIISIFPGKLHSK
jgi:hypothetical protein